MVRQWQDLFYEGRYASSYLDTVPDFVKMAEAFNAVGLRATKVNEVDDVIKESLKTDKPVLVDIEVDAYENCYPMIPAGGCNHEMILEDPPEMKRGEKPSSQVAGEDKDTVLTA
jgi:acetolactate synthase-1/2/3 large subunit